MDSEILPHNPEAEQGLLGSLLVWTENCYEIASLIQPDDFFIPVHAEIYIRIQETIAAGKTVSPVTLKPFFESSEALAKLGGGTYLVDLALSVIHPNNIRSYAETIKRLSDRRKLIIAVQDSYRGLLDSTVDHEEIRSELFQAIEGQTKSNIIRTKREVASDAVMAMQMPSQRYPTGIQSIDRAMAGGLYAGFTYAICAPEKRGKTTFAHTISHNLNNAGVDHAYIALEMGSTQIEQRNLARELGVNSLAFLSEKKSVELIRQVADIASRLPDHTLYLDMPACSFAQIKSELAALAGKKKIKGFILDYWQLVGGCPPKQTKADFLYDVAQWCANFARKNGLWCIILSQVNRDGKVFGSAGLEKACDQLYFIEKCEDFGENTTNLWLNQTHSRYTPAGSIGSNSEPRFVIETASGPYVREI